MLFTINGDIREHEIKYESRYDLELENRLEDDPKQCSTDRGKYGELFDGSYDEVKKKIQDAHLARTLSKAFCQMPHS